MATETVAPRSRRRWLQFSLRTLLIVAFVVSLPLGWMAHEVARAHRQAETVAALEKKGCEVGYDYQLVLDPTTKRKQFTETAPHPAPEWLRRLLGDDVFTHVINVEVRGFSDADMRLLPSLHDLEGLTVCFDVSDQGLAPLRNMTKLKSLAIVGSERVTEAGLSNLSLLTNIENLCLLGRGLNGGALDDLRKLRKLKVLHLDEAIFDDRGAQSLRNFSALEMLFLTRTQAGDGCLQAIGELANLKRSDLRETRITDAGMRHLSQLTALEALVLDNTAISDDGLAVIKQLPRLRELEMDGCHVTDVGAAMLASCSQIEDLSLDRTQVTDAGLARVAEMPGLSYLSVSGTDIGDDGLLHLRKMPKLAVLSLTRTKITDAGIASLGGCSGLRFLMIDMMRATPQAISQLKARLPQCDVMQH